MAWIVYVEEGWRWARLDAEADVLAESSRGFATELECYADAERYGCTSYITPENLGK
jgi:hypothetical protein